MTNNLTDKQRHARRKGGLARARKYSPEQLSNWGRLGGRPRELTIDELRELLVVSNTGKGG